MNLENLPVIDWESAIKLAGNKREIAEEILGILIKNLPDDMTAINLSWQQKQYIEMGKHLHKLHGALCYCGLPRLKKLVVSLEKNIKQVEFDTLPELMRALNHEANQVMEVARQSMVST